MLLFHTYKVQNKPCRIRDRQTQSQKFLYRQRVGKEDGAGRKPIKINIAPIATSQQSKDAPYPFRHPDNKVGMTPSPTWGRHSYFLSMT
ncbi:hypothetical protein SAMN03080594_105120 [Arenibacter palladensis]|uniref:Uncharacterized protein n=1 Tax=Arenibacter palladensis TaxID=237373 RepID=A0A1M5CMN8_9FLAO|nr:hypothetical protein [Arenibacter palladensis]SHF56055.1 hypothetical protein SAMN03080594_105120 [Arenibacter palladensis]